MDKESFEKLPLSQQVQENSIQIKEFFDRLIAKINDLETKLNEAETLLKKYQ